MRHKYLSSLLMALITCVSLSVTTASATPAPVQPAAVIQTQNTTVDINSADVATLQRHLSGVGEAKAQAIVAYREANGAFASVDELMEVKGIGKALFERNRDRLTVN